MVLEHHPFVLWTRVHLSNNFFFYSVQYAHDGITALRSIQYTSNAPKCARHTCPQLCHAILNVNTLCTMQTYGHRGVLLEQHFPLPFLPDSALVMANQQMNKASGFDP